VSNSFSLDLRDNAFTDAHLRGLAKTISRQKDLKELVLWLPNNYLTDDGVFELFKALEDLKNLRVLIINLEWNFRISNKSLQTLCKYLPAMSQLKTLRVLMSK
jgi:Ran GTPase-activating protein (RanGAP) involved in mRNA processing and transport